MVDNIAGKPVNHRPNIFFIDLGPGKKAYLRYSIDGNIMAMESTFTPDEYRGKGLAAKITARAIEYAKEKKLKIRPLCSYSIRFFKQHPENKELLLE
jgi:uncharacterized protein